VSEAARRGGTPFVHRFYGPLWRQALDRGSRSLPRPLRQLLVPLFAAGLLPLLPELRRGVASNLERVLGPAGPVENAARAFRVLRHFGSMMTDMHAVQAGAPIPLPVTTLGEERLPDGPAILCTAHLGPWPLGPELLGRQGRAVTVVMAEEASAETERMAAARRDGSYRVLHSGGPAAATLALLAALRRGEWVALQIDRGPPSSSALPASAGDGADRPDLERSLLTLPFFGAPARFPAGPLVLGRASGAPLVPCFFAVRDGGLVVHIEPLLRVAHSGDRQRDLEEAGQSLVGLLERHVRAYPYQWFAFRDFWSGAV
jgi:lauroyl/myristoyl acyltransferase